MRRLLATVVFGVGTVGSLGCAGNATFVKKFPDGSGGEIALKAGGDMADVRKLAEKELGKDYEILSAVQSDQLPPDPMNPTAKSAPGEMRYTVRKKQPGLGGMPGGGPGLPGGGLTQAGFNSPAAGGNTWSPSASTPTGNSHPISVGAPGGASGMGGPAGGSNFGTGGIGAPPAMFGPNGQ